MLWQYRIHPTKRNKNIFKQYAARFKKIISLTQKSQNNYYINTSQNKSKATWSIINKSKFNFPKEPITEILKDDIKITDPKSIVNNFNNFFIDQASESYQTNNLRNDSQNKTRPSNHGIETKINSIFLTPTTPIEVDREIKQLKNTHSVGNDGICTKVIKYVSPDISAHLCYIINLCISNGIYPEKLKTSIVIPLHKKDDKRKMGNYRPIALIPIFSKLFEKVIYSRLYSYLEKYNILVDEQKGFRKGKSINMAIFDLLKTILGAIDNKIPTCAIFMDMSKAFDRVDHRTLIQKLSMYGIRGKALDLIYSYLQNRKQVVEITQICQKTRTEIKHRSNSKTVKMGVPQGSVLGPLLFLIYINDLPNHINQPMVLFADDSTVIIKSDKENDYEHVVNQTLNRIIQWLTENNLKINMNKTKIIHFHQRTKLTNINISYEGEIVHPVTDTKFLGINIDDRLTWKTHLENVCKRINKSSFALYKLSKIVNKEALLAAYHGLVAPVLRYGIISWGNSVDKESVFKAQKKCIRAMCNVDKTTSCQPYFKSLKILTMPSLYIYELNVFVKSNPNYYKTAFKSYYRQLRDKKRLDVEIPYGKTALINKSILVMSSLIYNKLPDNVKELPIHQFKSKLHKFLVHKCYYCVKDYLQDKHIDRDL